jgi:hypothetical protein
VTHDLDQAAQMDSILYMRGKQQSPNCLTQAEFSLSLDDLRQSLKNPYLSEETSKQENKAEED